MAHKDTNRKIGAIAIGRNEGERLHSCLESLRNVVDVVVYVDSGSTDGSREVAIKSGAHVVELDLDQPFTAARARNAGFAHLLTLGSSFDYVQFVDGDCQVDPSWIKHGSVFLEQSLDVAVVCGRRREKSPDATIWNKMIDDEWNTPIGEALACGGDALMRVAALEEVGGYNPHVIAGEEPEMCVRLRSEGWKIWRIDAEMTLHDAALTRFGQWWTRARRAGHAYAEGAAMHGDKGHFVHETRRALIWGVMLPLVSVIACLVTAWGFVLFMIWPLQMLRLRARGFDTLNAVFLTLAKLPEGQGVLQYHWGRIRGNRSAIIEYK